MQCHVSSCTYLKDATRIASNMSMWRQMCGFPSPIRSVNHKDAHLYDPEEFLEVNGAQAIMDSTQSLSLSPAIHVSSQAVNFVSPKSIPAPIIVYLGSNPDLHTAAHTAPQGTVT